MGSGHHTPPGSGRAAPRVRRGWAAAGPAGSRAGATRCAGPRASVSSPPCWPDSFLTPAPAAPSPLAPQARHEGAHHDAHHDAHHADADMVDGAAAGPNDGGGGDGRKPRPRRAAAAANDNLALPPAPSELSGGWPGSCVGVQLAPHVGTSQCMLPARRVRGAPACLPLVSLAGGSLAESFDSAAAAPACPPRSCVWVSGGAAVRLLPCGCATQQAVPAGRQTLVLPCAPPLSGWPTGAHLCLPACPPLGSPLLQTDGLRRALGCEGD